MAQPGETFPMQFALGILQLQQQRQNADAQLAEMRNQRAANNFLDKERLRFQEQTTLRDQAQKQAQLDMEKEAASARIKMETQRMEQERIESVSRSVADFGRTGTAFIPSYAASKIPALLGSSDPSVHYSTIELPGAGTLLQRFTGEDAAKVREVEARISDYRAKSALSVKRQQLVDLQVEEKRNAIAALQGGISTADARQANDQLEGLRKMSDQRVATLSTSTNPADRSLAREIAADPRRAFPEGSPERTRWDKLNTLLGAWHSTVTSGTPAPPKTNVDALEATDLKDALYSEPLAPPPAAPNVRIVGRIVDRGQVTLIGEHGERITPRNDAEASSLPVSQIGSIPLGPSPSASPPAAGASAGPSDPEKAEIDALIALQKDTSKPLEARQEARRKLKAYRERYPGY